MSIELELAKIHVHTPDSQEAKALDKSGMFHTIQISFDCVKHQYRKVYFTSFAEMTKAVESII